MAETLSKHRDRMRDLVPKSVAVAVAAASDWTAALLPEEQKHLTVGMAAARRREFTAGRACARRALVELGVDSAPVPVGPDRAPRWPAGIVGSITHTKGYCAAAVAREREIRSLGIDAEERVVLPREVRDLVCLPAEVSWCMGRDDGPWWPVVFFSAKEAIFKAWSSLVGTWLDFHDVHVELNPRSGTFVAAIASGPVHAAALVNLAPAIVTGRFATEVQLVRTAVVVGVDS
jgi:4'-phosphopantetheinyl transferase EntD